MSIHATCSCGKAFSARPDLAGKVVKCPACGGAFRVPQPAPSGPADDEPLDLGKLSLDQFGPLPAATPSRSLPSTSLTYTRARPRKSGSGGFPIALKIGLIVGGVAVAGVLGLALMLALLLPALQAARDAARRAVAQNDGAQPGGRMWQNYNSPTGGYSISMPGSPKVRSQPAASPIGFVTMHLVMVDLAREGACFASHFDLPPGGSWQATLDESMQEGLRTISGQVLASRDLTVAGNSARESDFEGTTDGQDFRGRMQVFRVGPTQYQLMWIGPKDTKSEDDQRQFFSSFQLTRAEVPTATPPAAPPPAQPAMSPASPPPPALPVTPPGFPAAGMTPPASPPSGMTHPESASPFAPTPATPGELNDSQRKSIYHALASHDQAVEMMARQADRVEHGGHHETAARFRKNVEERRRSLVQRLAATNGISEAEVEEIYQTGKRENWDR